MTTQNSCNQKQTGIQSNSGGGSFLERSFNNSGNRVS